LRFTPTNIVDVPELTENEISVLLAGKTVEKSLNLKEGDAFDLGSTRILVKFEMNGICKLRKMAEAEIEYAAKNRRVIE